MNTASKSAKGKAKLATKFGALWIEKPTLTGGDVEGQEHLVTVQTEDGIMKYSGRTVPAVGDVVDIVMNGIGQATIEGFYHEEGFVGFICRLHNPPAWWVRQDAEKPGSIWKGISGVFPNEVRTVSGERI